jgi:hypothetical protein
MLEDTQTQAIGQRDCSIGTVVVNQDAEIHEVGQFARGGRKRLLRVIGGHYNRNAFAVNHFLAASTID